MSTRLLDRRNPTRFLWIAALICGIHFPMEFAEGSDCRFGCRVRSAEQPKFQIERRRSCSPDELQAQENLVAGRQASATCNEMRLRLLKILLHTRIPLHTQIVFV